MTAPTSELDLAKLLLWECRRRELPLASQEWIRQAGRSKLALLSIEVETRSSFAIWTVLVEFLIGKIIVRTCKETW